MAELLAKEVTIVLKKFPPETPSEARKAEARMHVRNLGFPALFEDVDGVMRPVEPDPAITRLDDKPRPPYGWYREDMQE